MSTRTVSTGEEQRIETREQLIAPMAAGEKSPDRWRIGTEHEKLVYKTDDIGGIGERIVMPLRSAGNVPAGIFGASAFKSIIDWANSPSVSDKEDESWFSLAGLAEAPAGA